MQAKIGSMSLSDIYLFSCNRTCCKVRKSGGQIMHGPHPQHSLMIYLVRYWKLWDC